MQSPIDNIRLSKQARDQLIKLKRVTKLRHWNELCRWALCASLAEPSIPPDAKFQTDAVEMSWRTFGGEYSDVYLALLKARCFRDRLGTTDAVLANQLRLHLHRGISYLAGDRRIKDIATFVMHAAKLGELEKRSKPAGERS